MECITLHEELRLIERSESEVSTVWKGAHLLLFFLAFVFGSFCTFCFHMLMYLFDEKCVLFPKLLSLNSLRHNVIYEFIPENSEKADPLPVDFLSTQFIHKSACYLPTYVPLVSGIFGLVWTTMFLMCSSGSRSLSGLQRPWRVILPVFVFSLAMSILCIYSSTITYYGLQDLCLKLGHAIGSTSCSYTVNVATLAYERQIRGVYQATRLTITSAWLHTTCWMASAVLALVRILLAVDFRLVKIRAELIGDMDRMMERNEEHLQTVMPSRFHDKDNLNPDNSQVYSYFKNEHFDKIHEFGQLIDVGSDILFVSELPVTRSDQALLPEERNKSARNNAYELVRREHRFIVNLLYDVLDSLEYQTLSPSSIDNITPTDSSTEAIARQFGQQVILSKSQKLNEFDRNFESVTSTEAEEILKQIKKALLKKLDAQLIELTLESSDETNPMPSTSKKRSISFDSLPNIIPKMASKEPKKKDSIASIEKVNIEDAAIAHKSNLKTTVQDVAVQTEEKKKNKKHKVTISESPDMFSNERSDVDDGTSSDSTKNENTQTNPKEKQD